MPWDYEKYCKVCDHRALGDGHSKKEQRISQEYESWAASTKSIVTPRTVVDQFGRIIAWVLPGILPERLQVDTTLCLYHSNLMSILFVKNSFYEKSTRLAPELRAELARAQGKETFSWRYRQEYFSHGDQDQPQGLLNLSPAWFMAGWQVCLCEQHDIHEADRLIGTDGWIQKQPNTIQKAGYRLDGGRRRSIRSDLGYYENHAP